MASIFISYSQLDAEVSDGLAAALRDLGHTVSTVAEMHPGEKITDSLVRAVADSDAVVAIITERGLGTQFGERELAFVAGVADAKAGSVLLPIVVGEIDTPDYLAKWRQLFAHDLASVPSHARSISQIVEAARGSREPVEDEFTVREVRAKRITSGAAAIAGVVTAVAALVAALFTSSVPTQVEDLVQKTLRAEVVNVSETVRDLQQSVAALESQASAITKVPDDAALAGELQKLQGSVQGLEAQLSALEAAIVDDPAKAVALPILRRDLEALRTMYQAEIRLARQDINRVYDLNKWFIGLMFTMAIGILGLAVGNLIQGRGK